MLPSQLEASRVRVQEESYTIFLTVSSQSVIIIESTHGAPFERVLRKNKKTKGYRRDGNASLH